jgi:hypothetical protein
MRTRFNGFLIALFLSLAFYRANAQHALEVHAGYEMNIPSGSFRNYITDPAYKGFTVSLAYPFNEQFSLGLAVSYNDYYQKYGRKVYSDGEGSDISAVVSNSVQQVPIMITAGYTLLKTGIVRPYVGASGGINLASFDQYLGEFDNPESKLKPIVAGDAGVYIMLSRYSLTAIKLGGGYQYAPFDKGIDLSNWGLHAGIRFLLR